MSSHVVRYHDHGFWINDGVLQLWMHFVAERLCDPQLPEWLREMGEEWRKEIRIPGAGSPNPEFDRFLASQQELDVFLTLLPHVIMDIQRFGPHIPKDLANSWGLGGEGWWVRDDPTQPLIEKVTPAITALLTGDVNRIPPRSETVTML